MCRRFPSRKFAVAALAAAVFACLLFTAVQATPPSGQTYVGVKKCAACHFEQYMTWKKSKHSQSLEMLPPQYKTNGECLKCHATGFGEATGFKDEASTPNLAGNTCENCHGPGSEHAKIADGFATKKDLTDAEKKVVKESIWRVQQENVCARCHRAVTHKAHEKVEKK